MGTREEENGVAPAEKGTFGLLVPLPTTVLLGEENVVWKEPEKYKEDAEREGVMDRTGPSRPAKGGGDQESFWGK